MILFNIKTLFFVTISVLSLFPTRLDAISVKAYKSATELDYPPFSVTKSGEPDGFSVDLLKAVAGEMGFSLSIKIDKWCVVKDELKTGRLDILPLVGYTKKRDLVYDFTVPYIIMRGNIFVRKDSKSINSQEDLFGKRILVLNGDNSQEWALSIGLNKELTVTGTYVDAFKLLSSGEYDAVLAQGLVGEKIIKDHELENIVPVYVSSHDDIRKIKLNLIGYEQKFCFAVVEGDSELLSILNEGLAIVSQNGTFDDLYNKWFPFLVEKEELSAITIIIYLSSILIPVVMILLFSYSWIVRRQVKEKTSQIIKSQSNNKIIAEAFQKQFSSDEERLNYVIQKLSLITESEIGYLINVSNNEVAILSSYHSVSEDYNILDISDFVTHCNYICKSVETNKSIFVNEILKVDKRFKNNEFVDKLERLLILPVIYDGVINVVFLANKKSDYNSNNEDHASILLVGLWSMLQQSLQVSKIEYMSFHDELTGLYNRRFFEEERIRLDNARNYPITVVMGDVNGLKSVNDTLGHTLGDQLLKATGDIFRKNCRANDIICRWGGDEFVMLLPNTSELEAEVLLCRIREDAESAECTFGHISIAFGSETKKDKSQDISNLFLIAEELMYKNKADMGNSVRR